MQANRFNSCREQGFTLIELMMVITIAAILVGVAVPGMRDMLLKTRLSSATNALVGAIQQARSEAVKVNGTVVFCATAGLPADGDTPCDGSGWGGGWLVWFDFNGNGTFDVEADETTDYTVASGTSQSDFAYSGTLPDEIHFRSDASSDSTGELTICHGTEMGSRITINITGRPASEKIDDPASDC